MIFQRYDRSQLEDILKQRVEGLFEDDVLDDSVIRYCATIAARNEGDARMAIDLLRVATDIAERNGDSKITEAHVKSAKSSMEIDMIEEAVKTLAPQSKVVLLSVIKNTETGNTVMITGDVYNIYKQLAIRLQMPILTQRRVTDLISELDMMALINASIKSFGRAGRTKEIKLEVQKDIVERFKQDPLFKPLEDYVPPTQTKLM